MNDLDYVVSHGTVQPYVRRRGNKEVSMFMHHFGLPQYDSHKPVLTETTKAAGQVICDELNAGTITESEAKHRLDKIW